MIETAVICLFVVLAAGGAVAVAFVRHVLQAIIGLGICLFGMAGLFLALGSPFVAAMQVLIYIGGILVAMVFAMMLSVAMSHKVEFDIRKTSLAIGAAVVFFASVAPLIIDAKFATPGPVAPEAWELQQIGYGFTTTYNVIFETLSLVLLVAIVGAVLIAKRDPVTK
jgi:NADH-quinone oxidoreductase subunit J